MRANPLVLSDMEPTDQDAVRALILAGLGDHWGAIDEELNLDLVDIKAAYASGRTVVVRRGHQLVGTGTIIPRTAVTAQIIRMSVARTSRRAGLGRLIVEDLLCTARGWTARASCSKRRLRGRTS